MPAGGIPKDGPSAGITMTTALVSLLTGRAVRPDVGMTGEVTLQGRVLPIGGVKQKVLAAQRAGLDTVILPKRNGPDLDDVPEAVRDEMTFHLVDDVDDVLALALEPGPRGAEATASAESGASWHADDSCERQRATNSLGTVGSSPFIEPRWRFGEVDLLARLEREVAGHVLARGRPPA